MLVLGEYEQYMIEFWLRLDAFTIFWFQVLNFFELILAYPFDGKNQSLLAFQWPTFWRLDLRARVEFESKSLLTVLCHVPTFVNALSVGLNHCT